MKVLEFNNVSLTIGTSRILKEISFDVNKGEIFGLVGHNGAGKTSLIKILLGLTKGYSGTMRILSDDNLDTGRASVGAVLDSLNVDKRLTAQKYIHNISYMLGCNSTEDEKNLLKLVGLENTGKKRIENFSLGMKRRLMISSALVGHPQILVLDEPFNGIDAEGMADIRLLMQQLVSEGMSVLVTSHNIPELLKLSNRFGVMYCGNFIGTITDSELSSVKKGKTILKTNNPQQLVSTLKAKFPHVDCYANSPGEISVMCEKECSLFGEIRKSINESDITEITTGLMNEEEILLWKMNGHTI